MACGQWGGNVIADILNAELRNKGADLVGYGDLSEVSPELRYDLPVGVCVAVKYPKEVIQGIADHPTPEYYAQYRRLNELLDGIVTYGAQILQENGYRAVARTLSEVAKQQTDYSSLLPHKTVATRAGLGWIGKCALLVTEKYGSMVRISTILTDAPLPVSPPVNDSRCAGCSECQTHCPANAVQGNTWSPTVQRDELVDAAACCATARKLSFQYLQKEMTICGRCIVSCPYTKRYLQSTQP